MIQNDELKLMVKNNTENLTTRPIYKSSERMNTDYKLLLILFSFWKCQYLIISMCQLKYQISKDPIAWNDNQLKIAENYHFQLAH